MKYVITLFLILILGGFLTSLFCYVILPYSPSHTPQEIIFKVEPGERIYQVAKRLKEKNLIRSSLSFRLLAKAFSLENQIKIGEYILNTGTTPYEILQVLISGKSLEKPITIQEGFNMYQIGELLEQKGIGTKENFLTLCQNQDFIKQLLGEAKTSLEGYLFPETYQVNFYTKQEDLIRSMVKNFKKIWSLVNRNPKIPMDKHQAVILASMIEKETGDPSERELISSVFHNRLKKNMRLASDPTIIYGVLVETGILIKNIKRKHIQQKNLYNTYQISTLPHGPIANPGEKALWASLNPQNSPYLYFVSKNDGTHIFSKTYKEHNTHVWRYQIKPHKQKKTRTSL